MARSGDNGGKRKGNRSKHPKQRRYSDAEKAEALEVLKADGLAAAARATGCSKDTIGRWARAAGLDPVTYVERSTEEKKRAAAASVAVRRKKMLDNRANLSDALLERLTKPAVDLLAQRLQEEQDLAVKVKTAQDNLEAAVAALAATSLPDNPDDPLTPEEKAVLVEMRKEARASVADAKLILTAYRAARIPVRSLIGVLTRAVNDHLLLEGEKAEAGAAGGEPFSVVFSAPRPDRSAKIKVVQLPSEPAERYP